MRKHFFDFYKSTIAASVIFVSICGFVALIHFFFAAMRVDRIFVGSAKEWIVLDVELLGLLAAQRTGLVLGLVVALRTKVTNRHNSLLGARYYFDI